jgi:subtilisin family serine protease
VKFASGGSVTAIKVRLADQWRGTRADDDFHGYRIRYTSEGGPHVTLDLPAGMSEADIASLVESWGRTGDAVDDGNGLWRYLQADLYHPAWLPPDPVHALAVGARRAPGDHLPRMGVTAETRRRGKDGAGLRIGHVDTWTDVAHPVFAGVEIHQAGAGRDSQLHGTHTAGTLVGIDGCGGCSRAALYTYNGLPHGRGSEEEIARGIDWCTDQGCRLISLSLGGGVSGIIGQAVQRARRRGCAVFSAAGNSGGRNPIGSPARESTWIVLACTLAEPPQPADFTDGRTWHDYANRIYGFGDETVSAFPGGQYGGARGTSMACPSVATAGGLLINAGVAPLAAA